jgi:hypothetical protein
MLYSIRRKARKIFFSYIDFAMKSSLICFWLLILNEIKMYNHKFAILMDILIFTTLVIIARYIAKKYFKFSRKKLVNKDKRISRGLKHLRGQDIKVLNDVLYLNKERPVYIEHLIVFPGGILLIDPLDVDGSYYAYKDAKMWTLGINETGKSYDFYSPILKGEEHINYLKNYFEGDIDVNNLVVFTGKCKLNGEYLNNENNIISINELKYKLKEIINSEELLDHEDIVSIYNRLKRGNITDISLRNKYIN